MNNKQTTWRAVQPQYGEQERFLVFVDKWSPTLDAAQEEHAKMGKRTTKEKEDAAKRMEGQRGENAKRVLDSTAKVSGSIASMRTAAGKEISTIAKERCVSAEQKLRNVEQYALADLEAESRGFEGRGLAMIEEKKRIAEGTVQILRTRREECLAARALYREGIAHLGGKPDLRIEQDKPIRAAILEAEAVSAKAGEELKLWEQWFEEVEKRDHVLRTWLINLDPSLAQRLDTLLLENARGNAKPLIGEIDRLVKEEKIDKAFAREITRLAGEMNGRPTKQKLRYTWEKIADWIGNAWQSKTARTMMQKYSPTLLEKEDVRHNMMADYYHARTKDLESARQTNDVQTQVESIRIPGQQVFLEGEPFVFSSVKNGTILILRSPFNNATAAIDTKSLALTIIRDGHWNNMELEADTNPTKDPLAFSFKTVRIRSGRRAAA